MEDKKKELIILSIIKFLRNELAINSPNEDSNESLEVAVQCLESAYNVNAETAKVPIPDLMSFFNVPSGSEEVPRNTVVSEEGRLKAEELKVAGNNAMKDEQFDLAIKNYSEAIALNPTVAVYYCNRAAAYTRLNNHNEAIKDCKIAILLDSSYSKAYGRLGFSYSSINQHENARQSYLKAVELEPDNESYQNNLKLATEAVERGKALPEVSNFDFMSLMQNPSFLNMATQLLNSPDLHNIMDQVVSQTGTQDVQQAGQHLANLVQNANPQFLQVIRDRMSQINQTRPPQDQNPPPPGPEPNN